MLSTLAAVWAAEASLSSVLGESCQARHLRTGADVEGQETCADWTMAWV
jgi:hypothetical protein